jgi:hypothetical protein
MGRGVSPTDCVAKCAAVEPYVLPYGGSHHGDTVSTGVSPSREQKNGRLDCNSSRPMYSRLREIRAYRASMRF